MYVKSNWFWNLLRKLCFCILYVGFWKFCYDSGIFWNWIVGVNWKIKGRWKISKFEFIILLNFVLFDNVIFFVYCEWRSLLYL